MGYMHIDNLYKAQDILLFKECYALEKIHGSSAHVAWKAGVLNLFGGGCSAKAFEALFADNDLRAKFLALGHDIVTVYGEAYGGKMQGMSETYGRALKFIAFEVNVGGYWLDVPNANDVATKLGLEFVAWRRVSTDLAALDAERDAPSEQAFRNGAADRNVPDTFRHREGIVLRPLIEVTLNNGSRIIAKHKRPEFTERATVPEVDPAKRQILESAEAIALEWVTDMRLAHVLDRLGNPRDMADTPKVIAAMQDDVAREAAGEIVESKAARKAIGQRTVKLYKAIVMRIGGEA